MTLLRYHLTEAKHMSYIRCITAMGVYTMVAVAMGKARFGPMAAKFPLRTLPGLAGAEVGRQQRGTER